MLRRLVSLLLVLPAALTAVAPSEAQNLRLAGAATTQFTWQPPASPNGPVVRYDLLRAAGASGFSTAACVQYGLDTTSTSDNYSGSAFYLVRSVNQTGSTTGFDSQGTPITAPDCGTCGPESCNGLDDDCSGAIDDVPQLGAECSGGGTTNTGECLAAYTCDGTPGPGPYGLTCTQIISPAPEVCNGLDDSCDGAPDETFPTLGMACTKGAGICAGNGTVVCSGDQRNAICNATPNPAAARDELCNGLDDSCDGQVDERSSLPGSTCFNGSPHACLGWRDPMIRVGAPWVYQHEASRVDATFTSVGVAATRACANSGVLPWAPVTQGQAAAACAAVRDSANQPMRLCTAAEWTAACNVGVTTGNVWSYAANPTLYSNTTCNGLDRGMNASPPTGASASCYANQSSGRIYDMSGDLWEWTSTPVSFPEGTYYKLRGGAYNNPSLGTNCNFDFTILPQDTLLPDTGFRCCSNNAP